MDKTPTKSAIAHRSKRVDGQSFVLTLVMWTTELVLISSGALLHRPQTCVNEFLRPCINLSSPCSPTAWQNPQISVVILLHTLTSGHDGDSLPWGGATEVEEDHRSL